MVQAIPARYVPCSEDALMHVTIDDKTTLCGLQAVATPPGQFGGFCDECVVPLDAAISQGDMYLAPIKKSPPHTT